MNPFLPFYNMKIGMVDLAASSAEVVPSDQDRMLRYLGGAAMNRCLFHEYGDALIFGTGPLTGSFAPASSLLVATFKSPRFNHLCHIPFMLRTGPDMKFSGMDFLVVKGVAPELSMLYVNRGNVQILPAGHLRNLTLPGVIRALKRDSLPVGSVIVTGPAADHGIRHAAASVGVKGSLDKAGLASRMAERNLKGVVFGGTGGLSYDRNNPDQGRELVKRISADKNFKERGFTSVLNKLDGGTDAGRFLKQPGKKDMACYHCPSPCMTHVTFSWQDPGQTDVRKVQDGLILLDHTGYKSLSDKAGKNILPVLQRCLRDGLDPVAIAEVLPGSGTLTELLSAIEKIAANSPQPGEMSWKPGNRFGGGIAPILAGDLWEKRVGLAMILGICSLFLLRFPQITDTDLLRFISQDDVSLANLHEDFKSSINDITADS